MGHWVNPFRVPLRMFETHHGYLASTGPMGHLASGKLSLDTLILWLDSTWAILLARAYGHLSFWGCRHPRVSHRCEWYITNNSTRQQRLWSGTCILISDDFIFPWVPPFGDGSMESHDVSAITLRIYSTYGCYFSVLCFIDFQDMFPNALWSIHSLLWHWFYGLWSTLLLSPLGNRL